MKETAKQPLSGQYVPNTPPAQSAAGERHAPREASPEATIELRTAGFELVKAVDSGGFGVVYRARDHRNERDVAIKLIDRVAAQRRGTPQPLHEIASLSAMRHPNVVPLYESGSLSDGLVYLVMPWIDGESLRARLQHALKLPIDEVLRIGIELADALAALHLRGLVHRDVKPDNVLMSGDHPMLIDLGLVCTIRDATPEGVEPEPLIGTPAYMSPEQWKLGAPIDGRADVYALGCVLHELLTGHTRHEQNPLRSRAQNPFAWSDSAHPSDLVGFTNGVPPRDIPRLREQRPDAPVALERLLQRALAPDPEFRLASALRFKRALETIQSDRVNGTQQRRTRRIVLLSAIALGLIVPPAFKAFVRYTNSAATTPAPSR